MDNTIAIADIDFPTVSHSGLTHDEVAQAMANGQRNVMDTATSRSYLDIVRSNVFTLFNGIIFSAMIVVLLTGSWRDAVFGAIIVVNTGIGVITEIRAKKTLDRLSILIAAPIYVHRQGHNYRINHDDIVLNDLLWVQSGDQVPADGQVLESWGLEMNESMLTGESRTVKKQVDDSIYSGSTAVSGMALMHVTAVGNESYAAKLTAEAKVYKKTHSDLNDGINTILKFMTFIVVPLCCVLILTQIHVVGGWSQALATGAWRGAVVAAVAGVIGMIPEGLVLLTSLNFALAAMRLAYKQTLVQELEAVETLARVDALNLDKTGTITDGTIALHRVVTLDTNGVVNSTVFGNNQQDDIVDERSHNNLQVNNSYNFNAQSSLAGDAHANVLLKALYDVAHEENPNATAQAILTSLEAQSKSILHSESVPSEVISRIPFSSARKWSMVGYADNDYWYFGAPEVLLSAMSVDEEFHDRVLDQVNAFAHRGERVLLLAHSGVMGAGETLPSSLSPAALIVCGENIRHDARETLAYFRDQGVRCRIISGDNPTTVAAIAQRVELMGKDVAVRARDARTLPTDIHALAEELESIDVLGRVLPEQKKAIVQALHSKDHVVAMTGDGVNDSLAIKEADLGIAMGNAASATKAVAQVVLVDSQFSHLPDVVAHGRQVMANMERVASLFLVKTVYSALLALGVVCFVEPFPYLPRHITYIGALTIGIPAFILALAPNSQRYKPGFLRRVVLFALPSGIGIAVAMLLAMQIIPRWNGWMPLTGDNLVYTRSACASILFVLGIMVLARIAKPLCSWRGLLVLAMAVIGVVGAIIPPVAKFFAITFADQITHVVNIGIFAILSIVFVIIAIVVIPRCYEFLHRFHLKK